MINSEVYKQSIIYNIGLSTPVMIDQTPPSISYKKQYPKFFEELEHPEVEVNKKEESVVEQETIYDLPEDVQNAGFTEGSKAKLGNKEA